MLPSATSPGNLSGPRAHKQVGDKRNDRKQEQQVNQSARYVKHQKSASPYNQQQQSNNQEGPESHFCFSC
jgi:hypothetical protein